MPWKETCPVEQRLQIVIEHRSGTVSMAELCRVFGIAGARPKQVRTSVDRWARGRIPGTMLIQDGTNETAFDAAAHLGWEAATCGAKAQVGAARRTARVPATPVEAPSGARDLAHAAARMEPSQPPQLPRALDGIRRSLQSRWLPGDPLLCPRKSRPPDRGSGRCRAALARVAGTRGANRAPSQPADGSDREGVRGPLPPACPAVAGRGRAGGRIRAGQLRRARAATGRARRSGRAGRVQLRTPDGHGTAAGCPGANLVASCRLAPRPGRLQGSCVDDRAPSFAFGQEAQPLRETD